MLAGAKRLGLSVVTSAIPICSMEATGLFCQEHGFGNDGNGFFPTSILRGQDWVSILGFVILRQKRIVEKFHEIQLVVGPCQYAPILGASQGQNGTVLTLFQASLSLLALPLALVLVLEFLFL